MIKKESSGAIASELFLIEKSYLLKDFFFRLRQNPKILSAAALGSATGPLKNLAIRISAALALSWMVTLLPSEILIPERQRTERIARR